MVPVQNQVRFKRRQESSKENITKLTVSSIGPDGFLVRLNFTGLCSSEIHKMKGVHRCQPLACDHLGHKGADVVVKVGQSVKTF